MFRINKKANTILTVTVCMLLVSLFYNCNTQQEATTSQSLFSQHINFPAQLPDAKIGARGAESALDQQVATLWDEANTAYTSGKYNDAVNSLKQIENLDGVFETQSESNFYYALGNAQLKQGNSEAAARSFANVTAGELSEDAVWKQALSMLAVEEQRDNAKAALSVIASSSHANSALAGSIMAEVENMPGPPVAVAGSNITTGVIPLTVTFSSAGTTDPDNDIINYAWNFGDGNTAFGTSVTHTFYEPNIYEVTLVVFDMFGQADQASVRVAISAPIGQYEMSLPAIEDATIQVGTTLNEPTLQAGLNRDSYLKFSTESVFGAITKTELELSYEGITAENGNVMVHRGSHNAWSEGSVNTSNAPAKTGLLAQQNKIFNLGDLDRWDLNSTTKEEFSVVLSSNTTTSTFVFGASEYYFEDGQPKVVVNVDNSSGEGQFSLLDPLYLEAECAIIGTAWTNKTQANASNGKYLLYPGVQQEFSSPPSQSNRHVRFAFFMTSAGEYDLYIRALLNNNFNNSFWVRINNGTWIKFSDIQRAFGFKWHHVHDNNQGGQTVTHTFNPGYNFIDIGVMEDGTKLDKLALIPAGGPIPTGTGQSASNCQGGNSSDTATSETTMGTSREAVETEDTTTPAITAATNLSEEVEIYPNPFFNDVTLDMDLTAKKVDVRVFNLEGKLVKEYRQVAGNETLLVGGELTNGNYVVHVSAGSQVFYKKIQKVAE